MKENFERAFEFVMRAEGNKVTNDKDDPGGLTSKGGITLATMQSLKLDLNDDGVVDADDLYLVDWKVVRDVFREHYWDAIDADDLPRGIDLFLSDWAYNAGTGRVKKWLSNESLDEIKCARDAFYDNLVAKNSVLKKYIKGWKNRSRKAYEEALKCE